MTNAWDEQIAALEKRDRAGRERNRQMLRPSELRKKPKRHFTPRRRGPEQIKFPMRSDKALMRLTNRPTLAKAKIAYVHYVIARYIRLGRSKKVARDKAKKELRAFLDGPCTLEFFRFHAEEYAKWPRPNFEAAAHEQRLSNFLSKVSPK